MDTRRVVISDYYGPYAEELVAVIDSRVMGEKAIDARFAIQKVNRTHSAEDTLKGKQPGHFCVHIYMPVRNHNWSPVGTKYGAATNNAIKRLPIETRISKLDSFWKKYPQTKPEHWMQEAAMEKEA